MKCSACAASLDDDAVYCSACGTEVAAAASTAPGSGHEIALAAANLLRLRGNFDEAEARCIDVLRADPNDVHAHSLLGDVYADQGRMDDARQWYQMALDLNPHSRPDREKLARLNRSVGARGLAFESEADERFVGIRSVSWIRWLAAVLAVCLLGAFAAILASRLNQRTARPRESAQALSQGVSLAGAQSVGAQVATAGRPIFRGEQMTEDAADSADGMEGNETLAEREAILERALIAAGPESTTDRSQIVVLTGSGRQALLFVYHEYAGMPNEVDVAREILKTVHTLLQADAEVRAVDVVVRASGPAVPIHTLWRARALRQTLAADTTSDTDSDVLGAFAWRTWTPAWEDGAVPGASSE